MLHEEPVRGNLSFLITALVPKWRQGESGIYERNIDFEILDSDLLSFPFKGVIATLFYNLPAMLFIDLVDQ